MIDTTHSQTPFQPYSRKTKPLHSPVKVTQSPSTPLKDTSTLSDILAKTINRNELAPKIPVKPYRNVSVGRMHLRNRPRQKNTEKCSLSIEVTQKSLPPKRKITPSILQKITQTLALYPHIARPPYSIRSRFRTQSEDQQSSEPQHLGISMDKLVLWSESKLHKIITKIYEFLLQGKREHDLKHRPRRFNHPKASFDRLLKLFLMEKYKTDKLCRENLINMCYSLYYHLEQADSLSKAVHQIKNKPVEHFTTLKQYQIFQNILNLQYDDEDIVFYLYGYVILKEISQPKGSKNGSLLTLAQLKEGLGTLTSNDQQLMSFYVHSLANPPQQSYQMYSVLSFLLNDFKAKKQKIKMKEEQHSDQQNPPEHIEEKYSLAYDRTFWVSQRPSKVTVAQALQPHLAKQFKKQLDKLIGLLFDDVSKQHQKFLTNLISTKLMRLFGAVSSPGAQIWFDELGLCHSSRSNRDILEVQLLQRSLRQMAILASKDHLQSGQVREFVKKLFTTRRLLTKLQELTESIENWQTARTNDFSHA